MTGTFSAVGASIAELLQPQETATFALSGASLYVFNGTVALEVSRNGGASYETAIATDGTVLRYAGAQSADFAVSKTVKNEGIAQAHYRVVCRVFDVASDTLTYAFSNVASDIVETILSDQRGRPVLQVLDNGGLYVPGRLNVAGAASVAGAVSVIGQLSAGSINTDGAAIANGVYELVADVTISAADIISTSAGKFGHADGYPLVAAPGADVALELVSVVLISDRATAAYTGGGNISVNAAAGAALTGIVSAANTLGAATDKVAILRPLAAAGEVVAPNVGINLVAASAFTNPGTAAGVIRLKVRYRLITLGLS